MQRKYIDQLRPVLFVLLASMILAVVCCKKKNSASPAEEETENPFDKQAMLENLADNLIVPSYKDFKNSLDSLNATFETFTSSGTESNFQELKQKFTSAYLKYQRVSIFGFGPAEDVSVRNNFNIFPSDTNKIKKNINDGGYDLASAANTNAKGLPVLDYILFGVNPSEATQRQLLFSNKKRQEYVQSILNDLRSKMNTVVSSWASYRGTFVSSLGTDVSSSLGFLINQLNYEVDYLKNSKIAIPLGLKSDGKPKPDNCEGFYGANSMAYIAETLNSIENVYLGRSIAGADGKGFDDYLEHLKVMHVDETLNKAIKTQINNTRTSLNAIPEPLSSAVISNSALVNNAYKEILKLLVLLKTDMPSNLGVVITYQDGDGD